MDSQRFPRIERLDLQQQLAESFIGAGSAASLPTLTELRLRQYHAKEAAFEWHASSLPSLQRVWLDWTLMRPHKSVLPVLHGLRTCVYAFVGSGDLLHHRAAPNLRMLALRLLHDENCNCLALRLFLVKRSLIRCVLCVQLSAWHRCCLICARTKCSDRPQSCTLSESEPAIITGRLTLCVLSVRADSSAVWRLPMWKPCCRGRGRTRCSSKRKSPVSRSRSWHRF